MRRGPGIGERGQASVELLGLLPAVLALALILLQVLAVGYASVLAGNAAEAGALALAAGGDPVAGAREALPGWSRADAEVSVERRADRGSPAAARAAQGTGPQARSARERGGRAVSKRWETVDRWSLESERSPHAGMRL